MNSKRIRRCHDLSAVTRLIGRDSRFGLAMRRLRQTQTKEHYFVLSAPATAALAIDEFGIEWPADRPLRIALLATATYEFLNHGQWFRFVPAMLPGAGEIEIHAFGHSPDSARESTAINVLDRRFDICTRWTDASFTAASIEDKFDLALSFSGLTGGDELLAELKCLQQRNVPLYLTSFSSTHALLTHAVLRAHGAEACPVIATNPFGMVTKRAGENWNRVVSKLLVENLPPPGTRLDYDYLDSLHIAAAMVFQSHTLGDPSQTWPVGGVVKPGVVHTLDGIAVHVDTSEIVDLNDNQTLGALSRRFSEAVREFDEDWDETDKLIWASTIRYLAMAEGMTCADSPGGAAA